MATRAGVSNLARWRHVRRCVHMQSARFSISPFLRALLPGPGPNPMPKPRSKNGSSKAVASAPQSPIKSNHSDWTYVFAKIAVRWKSRWQARYAESLSHRVTVHGVFFFCFCVILYPFLYFGSGAYYWQETRQLVVTIHADGAG